MLSGAARRRNGDDREAASTSVYAARHTVTSLITGNLQVLVARCDQLASFTPGTPDGKSQVKPDDWRLRPRGTAISLGELLLRSLALTSGAGSPH